MAARDELVEFVTDQLRPWASVSSRRLFSGSGLCRGSVLFALLIRDTLYFRSDDGNRPDYEAAGMAPFSYTRSDGRIVSLPYRQVPADVIEDSDELARWADKAFAAALRKPVKRKPRGKRKTARARPGRKGAT